MFKLMRVSKSVLAFITSYSFYWSRVIGHYLCRDVVPALDKDLYFMVLPPRGYHHAMTMFMAIMDVAECPLLLSDYPGESVDYFKICSFVFKPSLEQSQSLPAEIHQHILYARFMEDLPDVSVHTKKFIVSNYVNNCMLPEHARVIGGIFGYGIKQRVSALKKLPQIFEAFLV